MAGLYRVPCFFNCMKLLCAHLHCPAWYGLHSDMLLIFDSKIPGLLSSCRQLPSVWESGDPPQLSKGEECWQLFGGVCPCLVRALPCCRVDEEAVLEYHVRHSFRQVHVGHVGGGERAPDTIHDCPICSFYQTILFRVVGYISRHSGAKLAGGLDGSRGNVLFCIITVYDGWCLCAY